MLNYLNGALLTSYQGGPAAAVESIRIDLVATTVLPRYEGLGNSLTL